MRISDWSSDVCSSDLTRVLDGEVGDYATIVRKDRKSDDWYLGSVTDEDARTLSISLSFLDPGRTYRAEIYRDGLGADYRRSEEHTSELQSLMRISYAVF